MGNGTAEKIGLRDEVSVKDSNEFALGGFETVFQGAGFEAFAIGPMNVDNGEALGRMAFDAGAGDLAGFVGGVVQDLDVEKLAGIVKTGHSVNQAFNNVALVKDRKLDSDTRPALNFGRSSWDVFGVDVIVVDEPIAVQAVEREDEQNQEVGDHHCDVKGVGVIDAIESAIGELVPILAKRGLGGKGERCEGHHESLLELSPKAT